MTSLFIPDQEFINDLERLRDIVTHDQNDDYDDVYTINAIPPASFDRMYALLHAICARGSIRCPSVFEYASGDLVLIWEHQLTCEIVTSGAIDVFYYTNEGIPLSRYYHLDAEEDRGLPGTLEDIAEYMWEILSGLPVKG